MPPRFTRHLRERLQARQIAEDDVSAIIARPAREEHDPTNHSYKLYGWTTEGRWIYVAVTEDSWRTEHPVVKTAVEVS
ncbi:DUF4258 domain-containing protein [Streptomonospora nanhaiensis]|uniref:DUF4258 domain-containing protein n=1 Tax=Streptomonospora nanhaiensis TaxID=1323731 RepID=UPI0015CE0A47